MEGKEATHNSRLWNYPETWTRSPCDQKIGRCSLTLPNTYKVIHSGFRNPIHTPYGWGTSTGSTGGKRRWSHYQWRKKKILQESLYLALVHKELQIEDAVSFFFSCMICWLGPTLNTLCISGPLITGKTLNYLREYSDGLRKYIFIEDVTLRRTHKRLNFHTGRETTVEKRDKSLQVDNFKLFTL